MELMLIPKDKMRDIKDILDNTPTHTSIAEAQVGQENDPWKDLLEDS